LGPRNRDARSARLASSVPRSKDANVLYDQQPLNVLPSAQFDAAQTVPIWRDWKRAPAGLSTMEQDDPEMSRFSARVGRQAPVWRSSFAGSTLDAGFGRSDGFTNRAFSQTARQSHNADLRHIRRTGPSRVTRVC
jgi:hypothetical protein